MLSVNCQTVIKLLKFVSSQSTNPQDSLVYTWDCMYENHLVTSHSTHSHLSSLQQFTAVMVIKETIKLSPLFIHASQSKCYIGDSWGRQPSKPEGIIDESCDNFFLPILIHLTTIQVTMHWVLKPSDTYTPFNFHAVSAVYVLMTHFGRKNKHHCCNDG